MIEIRRDVIQNLADTIGKLNSAVKIYNRLVRSFGRFLREGSEIVAKINDPVLRKQFEDLFRNMSSDIAITVLDVGRITEAAEASFDKGLSALRDQKS